MTTSITSGQRKQYSRFVEDAAEKALEVVGLNKDGVQTLLGRGGELQDGIIDLLRKHSVSNQFANEEVASSYGYLSGYTSPKPIAEQVKLLKEFFPNLSTVDESIATRDLPTIDAEGFFAIPRWERLAPTYGMAVQKVLDFIKQTRDGKFQNYREGKLGPGYLRQHSRTVEKFQQLGEQQEGHDFLVVPCQFGILHRGQSVRRAREVMAVGEFGLDAFSVGIILLTQPERLQHLDDLWIDCAGDEYAPVADGAFDEAPCFYFRDGQVGFDAYRVSYADDYFGSVSAFLAQ